MPEIVSIFQAPLWKKIVVSSNDSAGYASSYSVTEEFSGLQLRELALSNYTLLCKVYKSMLNKRWIT